MTRKSLTFTWGLLGGLLFATMAVMSQPRPAAADKLAADGLQALKPDETTVQETILTVASCNGQPGYQLAPSEQASVYLPVAARGAQGDLNTTLFVQNTAASMATITVTFYYSTGIVAHTFGDTLPAHGSRSYEQVAMGDLPYGFEGSTIVTADQPVLAMANVERTGGGLEAYDGVLTGTTEVVGLLVQRQYQGDGDLLTDVWIQNVGAIPADVTIDFIPAPGFSPPFSITDTIPAAASHVYRIVDMPIPAGEMWIGTAMIQANVPVAVVTRQYKVGYPSIGSARSTIPPDLVFHLPRQQRSVAGHLDVWYTALHMFNPGPNQADIQIAYYASDGSPVGVYYDTVLAGSAQTYFPIHGPDGFDGAVTITSTEPLVVDSPLFGVSSPVKQSQYLGIGQQQLSREIDLPRVVHSETPEVSTEFSVQNPVSVASSITTTYYDHSGFPTTVQYDTIPAHGIHRYDTADVGALGSNWEGSVSISASQPIAVEATEFQNYVLVDRAWLFLVYLNGDNNLADALWPQIAELTAASASVPDAQVLVLWDGEGSNDSALYHVADGIVTPVTAAWLGAEADMGASQTLVDFVQWARGEYPSTYTFLSLLDHGGGWSPTVAVEAERRAAQVTFPSLEYYRFKGGTGMSWDLHTGGGDSSYLSTSEMRGALEALTNAGAQPIDVLFYDACLMGMLEEVHDFSPYVDYFVASENEAWASHAYDDYLAAIETGYTAATPAELAGGIVTAYEASLQQAGADAHPYAGGARPVAHGYRERHVRRAGGGAARQCGQCDDPRGGVHGVLEHAKVRLGLGPGA